MSDEQNPAVTKRTTVPPSLIEAVASDALAAQPVLRAQAIVQLHELHTMRQNMSPVQRMQLAEMVAKLGDMVPRTKESSGPTGAVTINFIRSGRESVTIEANAVTVDG